MPKPSLRIKIAGRFRVHCADSDPTCATAVIVLTVWSMRQMFFHIAQMDGIDESLPWSATQVQEDEVHVYVRLFPTFVAFWLHGQRCNKPEKQPKAPSIYHGVMLSLASKVATQSAHTEMLRSSGDVHAHCAVAKI